MSGILKWWYGAQKSWQSNWQVFGMWVHHFPLLSFLIGPSSGLGTPSIDFVFQSAPKAPKQNEQRVRNAALEFHLLNNDELLLSDPNLNVSPYFQKNLCIVKHVNVQAGCQHSGPLSSAGKAKPMRCRSVSVAETPGPLPSCRLSMGPWPSGTCSLLAGTSNGTPVQWWDGAWGRSRRQAFCSWPPWTVLKQGYLAISVRFWLSSWSLILSERKTVFLPAYRVAPRLSHSESCPRMVREPRGEENGQMTRLMALRPAALVILCQKKMCSLSGQLGGEDLPNPEWVLRGYTKRTGSVRAHH